MELVNLLLTGQITSIILQQKLHLFLNGTFSDNKDGGHNIKY